MGVFLSDIHTETERTDGWRQAYSSCIDSAVFDYGIGFAGTSCFNREGARAAMRYKIFVKDSAHVAHCHTQVQFYSWGDTDVAIVHGHHVYAQRTIVVLADNVLKYRHKSIGQRL